MEPNTRGAKKKRWCLMRQLRQIFDMFDNDKSGAIDLAELEALMECGDGRADRAGGDRTLACRPTCTPVHRHMSTSHSEQPIAIVDTDWSLRSFIQVPLANWVAMFSSHRVLNSRKIANP
jgi:EF-hand domain